MSAFGPVADIAATALKCWSAFTGASFPGVYSAQPYWPVGPRLLALLSGSRALAAGFGAVVAAVLIPFIALAAEA